MTATLLPYHLFNDMFSVKTTQKLYYNIVYLCGQDCAEKHQTFTKMHGTIIPHIFYIFLSMQKYHIADLKRDLYIPYINNKSLG